MERRCRLFLAYFCIVVQGFRLCGGDEGAFRSPPRPLRSALPCLLTFAGRFLVSGLFGLPLKPQKYAKNQHKHPIWHESCCRTGRFSCKNPLQNQQKTGTIEQEDGKTVFPERRGTHGFVRPDRSRDDWAKQLPYRGRGAHWADRVFAAGRKGGQGGCRAAWLVRQNIPRAWHRPRYRRRIAGDARRRLPPARFAGNRPSTGHGRAL